MKTKNRRIGRRKRRRRRKKKKDEREESGQHWFNLRMVAQVAGGGGDLNLTYEPSRQRMSTVLEL